ncbi:MAG: fibronectin type III domain-containing protein [Propionicimonas sp.]
MHPSFRRLLAWAVAALVLTGSGLLPPAPAQAATSAPAGLKSVSTSRNAVALSWKPASGVPKYRIQYSTSASMRSARYVRLADPYAEITGLKSSTTYYFRVRSIAADGKNLSSYSKAVKARTSGASGYSFLSPTGLRVAATAADSLSLAWGARSGNVRYRVSWSTSSSFANPKYVRITDARRVLTSLRAGTKYYLKVRVINAQGVNLSGYSPAISATTSARPHSPDLTVKPPTGLKVTATAREAAALAWSEVAGAERYRIQYSRSASGSPANYVRVSGATAEIRGLTAGKSYYFRIRVITPQGANLSPYSPAVSAKTPTNASASYLPPTGLRLDATGSNKASVAWSSRGSGLTYELDYARNAAFTGADTLLSSATSVTLTGLTAGTTYSTRVRVVSVSAGHRLPLSGYATVATARTPASAPSTLKVASYNIKCTSCYSAVANEGTWYQRRAAVVDTILGQKPDVIGVQEASQAWLKAGDGTGSSISLSQFEDLTKRLGAPYKLTDTDRNNCVKSTTPTRCVFKDQGASQGTKIIYNSAALTLIDKGSKRLAEINSGSNDRYVAWAILEQKSSGKRFFFANTHLEHLADPAGSSTYFDLRVKQTEEILAVVRAKGLGLPTYVVGDFNSHKWTLPRNGPYDTLIAAGFVDPLGNAVRSTRTTPGATVVNRIRTNFSSFNGFARHAPAFSYVNGTYLDYIWTSPSIAVPEWETVVNVNQAGDFVGVIPSDHNMIRATTTLP